MAPQHWQMLTDQGIASLRTAMGPVPMDSVFAPRSYSDSPSSLCKSELEPFPLQCQDTWSYSHCGSLSLVLYYYHLHPTYNLLFCSGLWGIPVGMSSVFCRCKCLQCYSVIVVLVWAPARYLWPGATQACWSTSGHYILGNTGGVPVNSSCQTKTVWKRYVNSQFRSHWRLGKTENISSQKDHLMENS